MYYDIVKDCDYANGCFNLQINWIPTTIIGVNKGSTGFIVQSIQRDVVASPAFMKYIKGNMDSYKHTYYEAWKVENGAVMLEKDYGFHDQWEYVVKGYYGMLEDFKNKYKTHGSVKMIGEVYWIDQNMSEYNGVMNKFKKGNVKYAADLISTYEFEDAKHLTPVCHREKSGNWDFMEDEKFIEAVISYTKKTQKGYKEWIDEISKYFGDIPICKQFVAAADNEFNK